MFRGGGALGRVSLTFPDRAPADGLPETLPVDLRNGLIALWITAVTGAGLNEAVADLPRLLGLSFGRPRLTDSLARGFRFGDDHSLRLHELYELELRSVAQELQDAVPAESLRIVDQQYGPLGSDAAFSARFYLLSRRLRAFGGRTLSSAVLAAKSNQLAHLSGVAPFGPIRLQNERAKRELRSTALVPRLLPALQMPAVNQVDQRSGARIEVLELLLASNLVPRLIGTFLRPAQPIYVIAFEHPARTTRDRAQLGMHLLSLLEILSERFDAGTMGAVREPLGIDLWLLRRGRLARNIGWRQLRTERETLAFTKATMVAFVEGADANLPVAAVGHAIPNS